jgi:hypothetical protein
MTGLFYLTGGLTALTGIHYAYRGLKLVSQNGAERENARG